MALSSDATFEVTRLGAREIAQQIKSGNLSLSDALSYTAMKGSAVPP